MAYSFQTAFGAGELDPALHERTTLEKYKTGLKTLRNAYVGKTGGIISRPGTSFDRSTKRGSAITAMVATPDHTLEKFTTSTPHGFCTGLQVQLTTTGTLPTGLALVTNYYVIEATATTFYLASALVNAWYFNTKQTFSDNGTGTLTVTPTDLTAKKCVIYAPPYSDYIVEFGDLYVRIHNLTLGSYEDGGHNFTEDSLQYLHFSYTDQFIYVSCHLGTFNLVRIVLGNLVSGDPDLSRRVEPFANLIYYAPRTAFGYSQSIVPTGAPGGYNVEYKVTYVINGEESPARFIVLNGILPVTGVSTIYQTITVVLNLFSYQVNYAKEIRIYRRPQYGQAFGFIGSSDQYSDVSSPPYTDRTFTFKDFGQTADYTNNPPKVQDDVSVDMFTNSYCYVYGVAHIIYQQRLIVNGTLSKNKEVSFASRPRYHSNFLRDYPIQSDSALAIRAGTSGTAKVLRYEDIGGLTAFTTQGIYQTPNGPLTDDTAYMIRRGEYVIDEKVPPLKIPGSVIFVDKATNSVVSIVYSDNEVSFQGTELSIYSAHLFDDTSIISWAYQDGAVPLIWCVMDDGSIVTLSYQNEQLLRAWSHSDTDGLFEDVTVVKESDTTSTVYFVVNRDGERVIETLSDRKITDIKDFIGMDSTVTYKEVLEATFTITPVTPGDYEGPMTLAASSAVFANTAGNGAVGTIFRHFHEEDGHSIDLEVTAYTSTTVLTVQPSTEFPHAVEDLTFTELYKTTVTVTGLDHLEGKSVSVLLDGFVEASPYNFQDNHNTYVVSGGSITLENRGAVVHVGLPYVVDIETLDIETVEQKPTLLESILCNKVLVKLHKSRGFWVGQSFPNDDSNDGMEDSETETQEEGDVSLATKPLEPYSKRVEVPVEGSWESQGRIAIRQVDPLPLQISSIIPDIDVQYKL